MKRGDFYGAIATLLGTIIGAGVLSIPYIFSKSGFLIGTAHLIVLGIASLIIFLYVGEIALRTKGKHQLSGYAEKYLGKNGKLLMSIAMIFSIYGALTAYLVGEGEVLSALFNSSENLKFSLFFFAVFSFLVYNGLRVVEEAEMFMNPFIILIILIICIFAGPMLNMSNLSTLNASNMFLPYGVILFALAGAIAVPEINEELAGKRKLIKKVIIIGVCIPMVLYFLFSLFSVGVMGSNTTEVATIGLGMVLGGRIIILGNLFAALAMATSFLTLGIGLMEMYNYDYKLNNFTSWLLTIIPPLFFFLLFKKSFATIIGITGGLFIGLQGVLIVLMYRNAKKKGNRKPEYSIKDRKWLDFLLIGVFIAGIIYTVLSALNIF